MNDLGDMDTAFQRSKGSMSAPVRRLNRGEPFVGRPTWLGVSTAVLLLIAGVLLTAYLVMSA